MKELAYRTNRNQKVKISVGAVEYLIDEVRRLRKQNEKMSIELTAYNRILTLTENIKSEHIGYSSIEDKLRKAEDEFLKELEEQDK